MSPRFGIMSIRVGDSQEGRFFDTSFNSNIVSIDIDDFCYLLKKLYSPKDVANIIRNAKETLSNQVKDFPCDVEEVFLFAAKSVLEALGKSQFGDFAVEKFKGVIKMLKDKKHFESK